MNEPIKAKTYLAPGSPSVVVDIILRPDTAGRCTVVYGKRQLVRHVHDLEPINERSKQFLKIN